MNRETLRRIDILEEADLSIAVINVQTNARLKGLFSAVELAGIATVASELGRNILKYGGGRGYLLVSWIEDPGLGTCAVEIKAVDYGPGFADVEAALKEHHSTGGTLGLGLPGAARIMDSLEIENQPSLGAVVTARKWAKSNAKHDRSR
jgi:serine/threonine-protein kinase RsbT